ncbi:type II toxin-antitoxin system RelE/ParE family toxin [Alloscardovia criceti]|uniref:type II toxin-antitoxin system RelE/ParE family toxin n=1 Tax=Alloscardovia criceti TaxID=356828 RepID=UPI0003801F8B|nr:type II toxin-antitoxin system RelE/ParE family toxin [Alloscardovia criceti]
MEIIESDEYADWIDSLKDKASVARIEAFFQRWEVTGIISGDIKPTSETGVAEVRFQFKRASAYRVYFAQKQNRLVLLLNGGDKKSKSQSKDIAKAAQILENMKQKGQW